MPERHWSVTFHNFLFPQFFAECFAQLFVQFFHFFYNFSYNFFHNILHNLFNLSKYFPTWWGLSGTQTSTSTNGRGYYNFFGCHYSKSDFSTSFRIWDPHTTPVSKFLKKKSVVVKTRTLALTFIKKYFTYSVLVPEMSSFVRQFYYYHKQNRKNIHVSL